MARFGFFLQRFGTGKGGMRIMRKMFELEKPCKDHLGNQYPSITEMCKAYKIKPETYNRRIKVYMWSVEKALTTPVKKNGGQYCYDHEGTRFKSESLMCQHWGIERKTYAYRRKKDSLLKRRLLISLSQERHIAKLKNRKDTSGCCHLAAQSS